MVNSGSVSVSHRTNVYITVICVYSGNLQKSRLPSEREKTPPRPLVVGYVIRGVEDPSGEAAAPVKSVDDHILQVLRADIIVSTTYVRADMSTKPSRKTVLFFA